ncbi:MAG: hypothetical protein QOE93_235 [Actinomycetota bacterium]|jgi:hypothetical protein|nr:hypothetical protein [Actinomycetota bacterium]
MTASLLPSGLRAPALLGTGPGAALGPVPEPVLAELDDIGFDLPELGRCDHERVLLILLFDNSPSVATECDPFGQRFEEAAIALAHCRRRCGCLRELVAVRTFDGHTSSDVGPVHLDGSGFRRVTAALTAPPELGDGWSRLRPALREAERLASWYPRHRPALVVFSDFLLQDWFPTAALARLGRFPGRVHAVVLGVDPPPALLAGSVAVSQIVADSPPGEVARAVVSVLADGPDGGASR